VLELFNLDLLSTHTRDRAPLKLTGVYVFFMLHVRSKIVVMVMCEQNLGMYNCTVG
jgi:hypothetical protein